MESPQEDESAELRAAPSSVSVMTALKAEGQGQPEDWRAGGHVGPSNFFVQYLECAGYS
jgi:hypothetical protein